MFCPQCRTEYRSGFTKCADCDAPLVPELPSEPPSSLEPEYPRFVTVRSFTYPWEAATAGSLLDAYEVPIFIMDWYVIYQNWLYSNALGGVKVQVPEEYGEEAQSLLSPDVKIDLPEGFFSEGTCPRCGSINTSCIVLGKRWSFLAWLVIGFPIIPLITRFRCFDCGIIYRAEE
jgi:hypothetical protein